MSAYSYDTLVNHSFIPSYAKIYLMHLYASILNGAIINLTYLKSKMSKNRVDKNMSVNILLYILCLRYI